MTHRTFTFPHIKARTLFMAALAALVLIPSTGHARDDDRHRGNDRNQSYQGRNNGHDNNRNNNNWNNGNNRYTYSHINLPPRNEYRVRQDLQRYYYNKCGSINSYNSRGCQPAGRGYGYYVGQTLPPYAVIWSLPNSVHYNLPAPRYGTRYAWVDRDLLLISEDRGTILDILLRL